MLALLSQRRARPAVRDASPAAPTPTCRGHSHAGGPSAVCLCTAPGPITLTFWEEDNDAADVLLDELAAAFIRDNPDIAIERVHFGYDDLRNQFRAASLFNGEPPDLVRAPGEFTGPFGELQIVKPADELFGPRRSTRCCPARSQAQPCTARSGACPTTSAAT